MQKMEVLQVLEKNAGRSFLQNAEQQTGISESTIHR